MILRAPTWCRCSEQPAVDREVMNGKRELSMSMVRKLRDRFHISADMLISPASATRAQRSPAAA